MRPRTVLLILAALLLPGGGIIALADIAWRFWKRSRA
jgi:hypothetical protein